MLSVVCSKSSLIEIIIMVMTLDYNGNGMDDYNGNAKGASERV